MTAQPVVGNIKRIPVEALQVGMYVHDLNCDWFDHPFLRNQFPVRDPGIIAEIRQAGIRELYIDTQRGLDHPQAEPEPEIRESLQQDLETIAVRPELPPVRVPRGEEQAMAARLHVAANRVITDILDDVRWGKQVELERVDPIVGSMVDSIFRCQDALLPLAQLKQHDEYTFQHSVSVCALLIAFARELGLSRDILHQVAVGGLLHDVGKAKIPDQILNKPGPLTPVELKIMQKHVVYSRQILENTPGVSRISLDVAAQHHERYNGTGYPLGLKEDQISLYGQMATIVDVYDAITSRRVYRQPLPPTKALSRLLEWSKFYFKPDLVHAFIHAIGIYPTGSLVKLRSQYLAVVTEQSPLNRLKPVVRLIFDTRSRLPVQPELVELARTDDAIESYQDPRTWDVQHLLLG